MLKASKKTMETNAFKRTSVVRARDLYAKYGERVNPKALHGTDAGTPTDVTPSGSAVIDSMIAGQNMIRRYTRSDEEKPSK